MPLDLRELLIFHHQTAAVRVSNSTGLQKYGLRRAGRVGPSASLFVPPEPYLAVTDGNLNPVRRLTYRKRGSHSDNPRSSSADGKRTQGVFRHLEERLTAHEPDLPHSISHHDSDLTVRVQSRFRSVG